MTIFIITKPFKEFDPPQFYGFLILLHCKTKDDFTDIVLVIGAQIQYTVF